MKPSEFNGVKDPIMSIGWISVVEGCFCTCSYPKDWKVRYALNLLHLDAKDFVEPGKWFLYSRSEGYY